MLMEPPVRLFSKDLEQAMSMMKSAGYHSASSWQQCKTSDIVAPRLQGPKPKFSWR